MVRRWALQPPTRCSRTCSTTLLDPARRAKINTTPRHTYPLTNPISLCQSGYQVIKEGVLPIDAFWHGAKGCINSPLSDRDLLPGVVGPGLRKPLWQDRPCTTVCLLPPELPDFSFELVYTGS